MRAWLLIALASALPAAAAAQTYPSKTITIIVPAPPGGVTDVLARTLGQRFTAAWGQQAIVENRPGGNNQVAAEYVTRSPPDGHTLLIGPEVTFIANPALYGRLNYDPINGFTAISGLVIAFESYKGPITTAASSGSAYVSVRCWSPSLSIEVTSLSPALSQTCLSFG